MQQLVVITSSGTMTGPKARVDSCPRCRRPLHLDHAGEVDEQGEFLDLSIVAFAQALHTSTCRG